MKRLVILFGLLLPAPAMAQTVDWQQPSTPPNDLSQMQSYSVVGQSDPQSSAAPAPSTQFIINNDNGDVVGTVTDAP